MIQPDARYRRAVVPLVLAASLWPRAAWADVVWPALVVEGRLLTWWAIGLGLLIEAAYIYRVLSVRSLGRALLVSVAMNAVSAGLGIVLIPLAGIVWEIFPGLVMYFAFNVGTFNPLTWTATAVLAVAINVCVERLVLTRGFKLSVSRRALWWLAVTNAVTVALAMASLWWAPAQY